MHRYGVYAIITNICANLVNINAGKESNVPRQTVQANPFTKYGSNKKVGYLKISNSYLLWFSHWGPDTLVRIWQDSLTIITNKFSNLTDTDSANTRNGMYIGSDEMRR